MITPPSSISPPEELIKEIPSLILSLGEQDFGKKLFQLLHKISGAEHASVFYLVSDKLREVIAVSLDGTNQAHEQASIYANEGLWRRDPTIQEAQKQLDDSGKAIVRTDIAHLQNRALRDNVYRKSKISDRVLICAGNAEGIIGLSLLRSSASGSFTAEELNRVQSVYDPLFALLAKHINVTLDGPNPVMALTSLAEIETCLKEEMSSMPRREIEVCSRVIYGVFNLGISLELGIGEETVMTYRKRAYSRLGIANQHELLLKYLEIWSNWQDKKKTSESH